jgi:hypothetical protein
MSSFSAIDSESSSPPHTLLNTPSSPPVLTHDSVIASMDKGPSFKSELPLTQDAQAVQASLRRINSDETERPTSAQQTQDGLDEQANANGEEESEEEDSDPSEKIEDFDWEELHHRYHEAVKICHGEEAELMQEWESLMAVLTPLSKSLVSKTTDNPI